MSYVDFKLSTEIDENATQQYYVDAYFNRGDYADEIDPITNETRKVYRRTERFKEVSLLFIPKQDTREEILQNLYDMLIEAKEPTEEVIQQCVYL